MLPVLPIVPIFIHTAGDVQALRRLRATFAEPLAECKDACDEAVKAARHCERLRRAAPSDPFLLLDAHALRHQSYIFAAAAAAAVDPLLALVLADDAPLRAAPAQLADTLRRLPACPADLVDLCPAEPAGAPPAPPAGAPPAPPAPPAARPEPLDPAQRLWSVPLPARAAGAAGPPPAAFLLRPRAAASFAALARNPRAAVPPLSVRAVCPAPFGAGPLADAHMRFVIYRDVTCPRLLRPCAILDARTGRAPPRDDILVAAPFRDAARHAGGCALVYLAPDDMPDAERARRAAECLHAAARMRVDSICIAYRAEHAFSHEPAVALAERPAAGRAPAHADLARNGFLAHAAAMHADVRVLVLPAPRPPGRAA
jgi:hypothetical protein